jgi:hypothetical protein
MSEDLENAASSLPEQDHSPDDARPQLPPADFDFLVYSLRLQAELSLGLLPFGENKKPDFELASHHIDLLAMLQAKTKGNLTIEEQRALDNSVTELRFRFVQAREAHAKEAQAKDAQKEQTASA